MALINNQRQTAKNGTPPAIVAAINGHPPTGATRDAEDQRKKARTLAKQQQAAERIAAATVQLSAGINEAASSA